MSRPTVYDAETKQRALCAVRGGTSVIEVANRYAICTGTLRGWMRDEGVRVRDINHGKSMGNIKGRTNEELIEALAHTVTQTSRTPTGASVLTRDDLLPWASPGRGVHMLNPRLKSGRLRAGEPLYVYVSAEEAERRLLSGPITVRARAVGRTEASCSHSA